MTTPHSSVLPAAGRAFVIPTAAREPITISTLQAQRAFEYPITFSIIINTWSSKPPSRLDRTLSARTGTRPTWWADACATCCSGANPPITTSQPTRPAQVMRIFPETYAVGAQFGVVLVPVDRLTAQDLEEAASASGRNPRAKPPSTKQSKSRPSAAMASTPMAAIRPGSLQQDRRKTCSGATSLSTACCWIRLNSDRVLDYVGGREDLDAN